MLPNVRPRSSNAINTLLFGSASQLVYVSCGFDAFKRDREVLEKEGGWKVERVEGHVLFPGADAVETVAVFGR